MSFFEYNHDSGIWRAALMDGTVDQGRIAEEISRMHPLTQHTSATVENIANVASGARSKFRRTQKAHGSTGEPHYCDFFVVGPAKLLGLEDDPPKDIVYLLQIEDGHPSYRELLQSAADGVGLKSRLPDEYADFCSFRNRFYQLAGHLIEPYVTPSSVVAQRLQSRGFPCAEE